MLRTVLIDIEPMPEPLAVGGFFTGVLHWWDEPHLEPVLAGGVHVYDRYAGVVGPPSGPPTEGVIRTIRVVAELHERSTGRWLPRPGFVRALEVPDTSPRHLRDDPPYPTARDRTEPPDPSTLRLVSEEEYLRIAGDRLPAEQWRPRGFLVELEVD